MFEPAQKRTLVTVCLGMFMVFLDGTVVNLALPSIQRDLDGGISGLQWIVDGYVLVYAALLLTGGVLGDRFGRKRLFMVGLGVFLLGSVVCAVAPSVGLLITGRVVQGVGAAMFVPGTLAILAHVFPDPRQRAQAIGIWSSVSGMSLALGPIVGGILVDQLGWQSIFLLNLPIGVVVLVLAARNLPETSDPQGRGLDVLGQLLAVVWLGALTYALIESNQLGWTSPEILVLLAVALLGLIAFLVVESRTEDSMLPLSLFRSVNFSTCVVVAVLIGFGLLGSFFFLSLFLQNVQGYSPLAAGLRLLPAVLALSVAAPLAGRLAGKYGSRWLMGIGMTIVAAVWLSFSLISADTPYSRWWPILVGLGFGVGLTMTPMIAAIIGSVPPYRIGLASATGNTAQQIGGVLGIALLGTIVADRFRSAFEAATAQLGVPGPVLAAIEQSATGAAPPGVDLPPSVDGPAVVNAVQTSFVDGMHQALLIAGIAYLVGAVAAVLLVRRVPPLRPPDDATPPAAGQRQSPGAVADS